MTVIPATGVSLTIYQGATFSQDFIFYSSPGVLMNLTGKKAKMMARAKFYDAAPLINLTTENGGIVNGGSNGVMTLKMSAAQTAALAPFVGVWDFYLVDATQNPEVDDRYFMGTLTVSESATK